MNSDAEAKSTISRAVYVEKKIEAYLIKLDQEIVNKKDKFSIRKIKEIFTNLNRLQYQYYKEYETENEDLSYYMSYFKIKYRIVNSIQSFLQHFWQLFSSLLHLSSVILE